jgi:hypothetical protein
VASPKRESASTIITAAAATKGRPSRQRSLASPQPARITAKLPSETGSMNTEETRCSPRKGRIVRPMSSGRMPLATSLSSRYMPMFGSPTPRAM